MCVWGHGNWYVLCGCRAWTRNPAAVLKRNVVCDVNLLPHAQPLSAAPQCVAVKGMWLWDEVALQDWPELLIPSWYLVFGTLKAYWGWERKTKLSVSSVLLQLAQLYYICEINHAFILHGSNRDLCTWGICIVQDAAAVLAVVLLLIAM